MNTVRTVFVDRKEGGFDADTSNLAISWLRQTHGRAVWTVDDAPVRGEVGDALVTADLGRPLAVRAADCAPILLTAKINAEPIGIAVVHAGWRGIVEGVIESSVDTLNEVLRRRGIGEADLDAQLFPCIGPECYEFSEPDLSVVSQACGPAVVATACGGGVALDMVAAVRAKLRQAGIFSLDLSKWECTACQSQKYFSHRLRQEPQRMGLVAWLQESSSAEDASIFGLKL